MRITGGTLSLVSSHVATATLEATRTISAWNERTRVDLRDAVKVELSGADASARLSRMAQQDADALKQSAPGRAIAAGIAPGFARAATHAPGLQRNPGPGSVDEPDGTDDSSDDALDAKSRTWLMLLNLVGDEGGAARLAHRLASFARSRHLDAAADTLDALAKEHSSGGAKVARATSSGEVSWGYRADYSATIREYESTSFAANAEVTTADGRRISVEAAFSMVRESMVSVSASVRLGQAAKDPLVLALEGGAPQLGEGSQAVDVDADGAAEQVAALAQGTVYLVRDRNGNGVVDDGSELFGPTTQDGFGELAALDGDRSGWIDEGDAAFGSLGVWDGREGSTITSLADAGIGALATDSAASQHSYGPAGSARGSLAASSLFLYEDGRAGVSGELKLEA